MQFLSLEIVCWWRCTANNNWWKNFNLTLFQGCNKHRETVMEYNFLYFFYLKNFVYTISLATFILIFMGLKLEYDHAVLPGYSSLRGAEESTELLSNVICFSPPRFHPLSLRHSRSSVWSKNLWFSVLICNIQQPGHWPYASKYDPVVTPLASFLEASLYCRSIKNERSTS